MQFQETIFTIILFLTYLFLWNIKQKELFKSEGVNANILSQSASPIQKYFNVLAKLMTGAIVIIIVVQAIFIDVFLCTTEVSIFNAELFNYIGLFLGLAGLGLCRLAQNTIGKSWRVGIDENAEPGLITDGIYRFVRNPTYSGLYLMCAGIWLINPTFLFSHWILVFFLMMEFQVRCEEEYLKQKYGNKYKAYCERTKRYIPKIY